MTDHLKTIAKGAGIFFGGILISKALFYVYRLIVARGLGPEVYGLFSLCFALVSLITALTVFGLPNAIERYLPYHIKDKERVKGIVVFSLKLSLTASLIALVLLLMFSDVVANLFKGDLGEPLKIFLISIPFLSFSQLYISVSKAFKRMDLQAYSQSILYPLVNVISAGIIVYFGFGINELAYGFVASAVVAALLLFVLIERNVFSIFSKIKSVFMRRELLAFSLPLSLAVIFGFVMLWVDTLILGFFMEEKFVGLYNAAVPTAMLLLIVPSALVSLLVPVLSELLSENKIKRIKEIYLRITEWIFFLNFPIVILFLMFSRQVLALLFGGVYTEASIAFSIVAIGYFAFSMSQAALKMMELKKKTKVYMWITIIASITNIVACLVLVPIYGIIGAALGSVFALLLMYAIPLVYVSITEKMQPFSLPMVKSGILAIVLAAIVYIISKIIFNVVTVPLLIPLLLIYAAIYLVILIFKIAGKEEKEILNLALSKIGIKIKF